MQDKRPWRTTRQISNLRSGKVDWYRIQDKTEHAPAQLNIYDEIGYFGVSAGDLISELATVSGELEVHVNSPGGDVFDGIAIYNFLKNRGQVSVVVDSLAASIASVIAMAASPGRLMMAKNSSIMIHDGFCAAIGNSADMRKTADLLDKASDNIASIYAERTRLPAAQWRDAMREETWYSAQEAVDIRLADAIQGVEPRAAWDLSIYQGPRRPENAKYNADDRKRMASSGQAMPDGSYPIADAEDLDNAIHAVGRGSGDHDAIRKHIIKRAAALGLSSRIPDNWNSDGSMTARAGDLPAWITALPAKEAASR
jgi:ATP-dependent protease ClpP protease subunit